MKKAKTSKLAIFGGILLSALGSAIFLYPVLSNELAKRQQEKVIVGYENHVSEIDQKSLNEEWEKAKTYNITKDNYEEVLNIEQNGVMGYIEIPKIKVSIPIYHGSGEESLKKGVGHIEKTGLPIGGKGNHPVLTGHRGLPNAELFTRLDELEIGDLFSISVLDEKLIYAVKEIKVVLPEKIQKIDEQENRDLVTLVTCTPYGVNTHRLLVTGERTFEIEINEIEQEMDHTKRNKFIFYIIIIFTGIAVTCYPYVGNKMYGYKINKQKKLFIKESKHSKNRLDKLYEELKQRNDELYLQKQKNLNSKEVYETPGINLKTYGINNNVVGYISIPAIKIELPILLGANEENMKLGAVHLTGTSYPVGGKNTNSVIAAHRGYSKAAMFRNLDQLKYGDKVYIRNFKSRLTYQVVKYQVVNPSDIDKIFIQEGKDMLTLITCHPYKKNSRRYIVFCERI